SRRKRARPASPGVAAATSAKRRSRTKVGSISMKARPRPQTPSRTWRCSSIKASPVQHERARAGTRDADHDAVLLLSLAQHQVAVIGLAGHQPGPAGAAGAALAGARQAMAPGAQRFQDGLVGGHL